MPVINQVSRKEPVFRLPTVPSIPELLQQADANPACWSLAAQLRVVLQQPINETTNRQYCQVCGELARILGYEERHMAWLRTYGARCSRTDLPGHEQAWYSVQGNCHCNVCYPRSRWAEFATLADMLPLDMETILKEAGG